MNKQQLLQSLRENIYCRVGLSKIQGAGVIAIRDIPKGTDPFGGSFRGNFIKFTKDELQGLDPAVTEIIKDMFVEEDGKILIPSCGLNRLDVSFFMNHSSTPNILPDMKTDKCSALRDIKKGEELTFDYEEYCGENPEKNS